MLRRLLPGDFLGDPFEAARNVVLGAVLETNIGGVRTAGLITEAEVYIGGSDKASHTYGYRRTERVMSQYEMGGHAYVFLVYGIHAQFCVVLGEKDVPNVVLVRSVMPLWGTDEMLRRRGKTKLDATLCAGPGNATRALGITTRLNGVDLCASDEIGLYVPAESETGAKRAGLHVPAESETSAKRAGLYVPAESETDANGAGLHVPVEPETGADRDISSHAVMACSEEMLRTILSARADEIVEAPRVGIDYAEEYAAVKWRYYYRNNRFVSKKLKI